MSSRIVFRLRLLHNARGDISYVLKFLLRFRLPGFGLEIEVSELTAAEETKHREDDMHALQLRLHLSDRLQVEPPKHGRACALFVVPRLFNA